MPSSHRLLDGPLLRNTCLVHNEALTGQRWVTHRPQLASSPAPLSGMRPSGRTQRAPPHGGPTAQNMQSPVEALRGGDRTLAAGARGIARV